MASKTHPEPNNPFLTEISQIEQSIANIQKNITRIKDLQSQLLISTSAFQTRSFASERDDLLNSTRTLLFHVKDRIKKIEYENTRISSTNPEFGLRKQRHQYLKEKFTNILEEYRGLEDQYMRQHMERLGRQYRVVNPDATEAEISNYLANPSNEAVFQQALLRTGEAREALAEVQKRHEDIKQIEATIAELAQLYQEMQLQVEAQDEALVNIEGNVDEALIKTEMAEQQIQQANEHAQAARKKKWICLAITIVIGLILVIVLALKFGGNSSSKNYNSNNASAPTVTVTKSSTPSTTASAAFPSKT